MNDWNIAPAILSVSDITEKMQNNLEKEFPFVWVQGEVANLSKPGSGHFYFIIKDEKAKLNCVWFRHNQLRRSPGDSFDPLTGEVYAHALPPLADSIANGMEILVAGKISMYTSRGQCQLLVEIAEFSGEGKLALAFEQKKKMLAAKGYFEAARKRKIPPNPTRVILITSPHGAAIHDFLEIASNRGFSSKIILFPVVVQGDRAAPEIAQAIKRANAMDWAQVIVIIRGGGSLEDLWAFNEEVLADAVFNSKIPIVAGIGHEIDVCLTDLVADLRAATPTHAAQLLWTDRNELWQKLDDLERLFNTSFERHIEKIKNNYHSLYNKLYFVSPIQNIYSEIELLDNMIKNINMSIVHYFEINNGNFLHYKNILTNYKFNLKFSLLLKQAINNKNTINILINKYLCTLTNLLNNLQQELDRSIALQLSNISYLYKQLEAYIYSSNPLLQIKKGYALLYLNDEVIDSVSMLNVNDKIKIQLHDGALTATINKIYPENKNGEKK